MAKKVIKKAKASKPAKKASKPAAKKASKPAKKAVAKKPAKKIKPAAKKAAKPVKKVAKPIAKKAAKPAKKVAPAKADKKTVKDLMVKKGKPIDAIKKGGKPDTKGKKGKKKGDDDDDDDVDVKDDYEKTEDEDVLEGDLEEPAVLDDGEIPPPSDEEDEDEVPIKKGRGRRKKSDGTSKGGSMEAYIRNRPLQIDLSKPLIKRNTEAEPKPFVNTKDNRSRYTDKELGEFKELILEKLKEAQADYDLLKQTLSNEDNHGTDDTSPTFKLLEDGSDVLSKEETAQLAARQEKYIINLKNALVRIENKTYGICRVSGKLIPKERLRSVPHATLGIDAKLNQNR
jgi:DnaK suppressor protein